MPGAFLRPRIRSAPRGTERERHLMQPTRVITHRNLPGVSVTCKKLNRAAYFDLIDEDEQSKRPVAIEGLDGKPLFDKNGQPFVAFVSNVGTLKGMASRVAKNISSWAGVTDEDGNAMPFRSDRGTVLVLWDERYDVTMPDGCVICEKPKSEHVEIKEGETAPDGWHPAIPTMAFGALINRKISDPKFFDSDPTGEGSLSS
jgi:hypothetical protein